MAANRILNLKTNIKRNFLGYMFVAPAVIFLITMTVYPLFRTFQLSVLEYSVKDRIGTFVGIQHYIKLLQDDLFLTALKNTLIFTIARVLIHIPVGFCLAILLNQKWPNVWSRNLFRGLLIVPWLLSNAIAALAWTLLYHPFGIINFTLLSLDFITKPISFLGDPKFAMISLVVTLSWKTYPFFMVMVLGALQSIPEELYDAAEVDGANLIQRIRHVTIPLIRPVLLTTITLELIWGFGHFDIVQMMTRGGPLRRTEVISFRVWETGFFGLNFGLGSAMSVIAFLILMIFVVIYIRLYTRGALSYD